ncbi:MAG: ABC transporter permease [Nakamurella sp.]
MSPPVTDRRTPGRGRQEPVGAPRTARVGRGLLTAALVGGAVLPLVPLLIWSVAGQWRYPAVVPQQFTVRGWARLFEPRTRIPEGLLTSVTIAVAVTVAACLIGFPAGRAIGLYRFRGRRLVQFLLLAPVVVPGLAVTLGIQVFFVRYHLADSLLGVILVQLMPTVPYAALIMGSAFAALDVDYEHQARALGASPLRVLLFVTVPLLRPSIAVAALMTFLISWSEYVLTLLVGGGQVRTLPLLLFAAIGSSDTTLAAVLALLVIAPPLVLVLAASRLLAGRGGGAVGFGRL